MKKPRAVFLLLALVAIPALVWHFWPRDGDQIPNVEPPQPESRIEEPATPVEYPQIAVAPRPGAVLLTVNFSSYCSPKPEMVYRVEEHKIFVNSTLPDGPLSRCVEPYRRAINVDGLEAGSYTVVWEGSGNMTPIPIEIP